MAGSDTEDSPYIATELLEFVIDALGAEAELLPTGSPAFQTLLSFALTGHRAVSRCQQNLFMVLAFDSAEHKGTNVPAWKHLENMLELFDRKPHLALCVRRLKISFYRSFSPNALAIRGVRLPSSDKPKRPEEIEETMLPQLLQKPKLRNVVSFSFDGLGCRPGGYPWYSLATPLQQSIIVFLGRSKEEGNALEALNLDNIIQIPPEIFKDMPQSLSTLRLASITNFDWPLASIGEKVKLLHARQWRFALTSLDFYSQSEFLETLFAYGGGKHLAQLQNLTCWVDSTHSTQVLGQLLSICASKLRTLDILVYGKTRHFSSLIRRIDSSGFPRLHSLSLACEIDGFVAQTTETACPGIIATLVGHIMGKAPALRTLSLHAVWSFLGPVDLTQPSLFMGKTQGR